MALTASDFARFLPAPVDPTSGAQAFSRSMANMTNDRQVGLQDERARAELAQQQLYQGQQIEQQRARLAHDQAAAQEIAKQKEFEKQKGQQTAIADFYSTMRGQSPADIAAAKAKLQAWGLDMDVADDAESATDDALGAFDAAHAPALTLDDVANPMAPPPPAKKSKRVRILRDGKEIGTPIAMDELIGPTQAALEQYVKSSSAMEPITQEEINAYMSVSGGDPEKALEMAHKERQLRKQPPPNPLLQGETGSDGGWNMKLSSEVQKYVTGYRVSSKLPEIRQQLNTTAKLRSLLKKAEDGTFDPVADRVAFTELLKSMAGSRPTDYDQKFLEKAGGVANMFETKYNEIFDRGRMTDNFRNSVRSLADAAERRASELVNAEVANAESGIEDLIYGIDPGASPEFVARMKSMGRRTLGGSKVKQARSNRGLGSGGGGAPKLTPAAQSALDDLGGN